MNLTKHHINNIRCLVQEKQQADAMWERVYQNCLDGDVDLDMLTCTMKLCMKIDKKILSQGLWDLATLSIQDDKK